MAFFWIVVIIFVVWWLASRSKNLSVFNPTYISEETVFKLREDFEKDLRDQINLPDAITHQDLYIYLHLMCSWYDKLSAENRYNEKMLQTLRQDWLSYMKLAKERETYNYLSMETWDEKNPKESDGWRDQHILASKKKFAIEDAFAAAVGNEAVEQLSRVRVMEYDKFNKSGEMAPDGFEYGLDGKLEPTK